MFLNGYNLNITPQIDELLNNYQDDFTPPKELVFNAFKQTSFDDVKVVILGQDPYPTPLVAMGLSFSINTGKLPASLKNMFKELETDLAITRIDGDLTDWANQGVLLLNTSLTTIVKKPNAHKKVGWNQLTDQVICDVSSKGRVIFILLGGEAHKKEKLIDVSSNVVIKCVHPSPLSVYRGFWGSKIYSRTNDALQSFDHSPINW